MQPAWKAWGCEICLPLVTFDYIWLPFVTGFDWAWLGLTYWAFLQHFLYLLTNVNYDLLSCSRSQKVDAPPESRMFLLNFLHNRELRIPSWTKIMFRHNRMITFHRCPLRARPEKHRIGSISILRSLKVDNGIKMRKESNFKPTNLSAWSSCTWSPWGRAGAPSPPWWGSPWWGRKCCRRDPRTWGPRHCGTPSTLSRNL